MLTKQIQKQIIDKDEHIEELCRKIDHRQFQNEVLWEVREAKAPGVWVALRLWVKAQEWRMRDEAALEEESLRRMVEWPAIAEMEAVM